MFWHPLFSVSSLSWIVCRIESISCLTSTCFLNSVSAMATHIHRSSDEIDGSFMDGFELVFRGFAELSKP